MKKKEWEDSFLEHIHTALDESCDNLDAGTLSRLRQVRETALSRNESRSFWRTIRIPAAGLATVAASLVIAFVYFGPLGDTTRIQTGLADLELIVSEESPDFYADLEFYTWLAEEDDSAV